MKPELQLMAWFIASLKNAEPMRAAPRSKKVIRLLELREKYPNFSVTDLARMVPMTHQEAFSAINRWCDDYIPHPRGRPSSK